MPVLPGHWLTYAFYYSRACSQSPVMISSSMLVIALLGRFMQLWVRPKFPSVVVWSLSESWGAASLDSFFLHLAMPASGLSWVCDHHSSSGEDFEAVRRFEFWGDCKLADLHETLLHMQVERNEIVAGRAWIILLVVNSLLFLFGFFLLKYVVGRGNLAHAWTCNSYLCRRRVSEGYVVRGGQGKNLRRTISTYSWLLKLLGENRWWSLFRGVRIKVPSLAASAGRKCTVVLTVPSLMTRVCCFCQCTVPAVSDSDESKSVDIVFMCSNSLH